MPVFCGWLVKARTVPLLQAVAGKNFELLTSSGLCNPTLVLGLRALQPNTFLGLKGSATQHSFFGFRVLQPSTLFGAQGFAPQHSF